MGKKLRLPNPKGPLLIPNKPDLDPFNTFSQDLNAATEKFYKSLNSEILSAGHQWLTDHFPGDKNKGLETVSEAAGAILEQIGEAGKALHDFAEANGIELKTDIFDKIKEEVQE